MTPLLAVVAFQSGPKPELYHVPPAEIASVMEEPFTPALDISPTRDRALLVGRARYRTIAQLAAPMLPLAGARIDPDNDGPARPLPIVSLRLLDLATRTEVPVNLPSSAIPYSVEWSPDGRRFAILLAYPTRIAVAVAEVANPQPRVFAIPINGAFGRAVQWMPDGRTLLVRRVDPNRGPAPVRPVVPGGPEVQQSLGVRRPAVTLPDALKDAFSEAQFTYYMSAQTTLVDVQTGRQTRVNNPGVNWATPSPDGKCVLIELIRPPYSRKLYWDGFPRETYVVNLAGGGVTPIAASPSEEGTPLGGVPKGPRDIHWREDRPQSLLWVEALDGGDPLAKAPYRDRLVQEDFDTNKPRELMRLEQRFRGLEMTERGGRGILTEYDYDREHTLRDLVNLDHPDAAPVLLSDVSTRERYRNPGSPVTRSLPNGQSVLLQSGDDILLEGAGAGPDGDHPFLDRLNLATRQTTRRWQCDPDHYERIVGVLSPSGDHIATLRESPTEFPNYFVRDLMGFRGQSVPLTRFANPHPELLGITKQIVKYKRPDGVDLSFTLYLPPGHKDGDRLPAVVDAYPLEYTDPSLAGQVTGSTKTFPTLHGDLLFLLAGYAVMDEVAMPIVGPPRTVNNTFVEQLVADAQAAVQAAAATGQVDTKRLGVMGHSYGAFMTANLLAHCDLFRAGAAESGAYNRTLTPFGFQSERRTFWQAPEMYLRVSPFAYADQIKAPILLIHGLQDDNPGTYTIQSERLYQAISGNGGAVRLVELPYEAHGYAARETMEDVVWEELTWFDRYVKG